MSRHITIDPNSTAHIKYGNLEKPPAPPSTYRLNPEQFAKRTPEDKRKAEWGEQVMPEGNQIQEEIALLEFQIKSMEESLTLGQGSYQMKRTEQLLNDLRAKVEHKKQILAANVTVNPAGMERRAALCQRLNLPFDTPARTVLSVLVGIADNPGSGLPSFVEDHFSPQDYVDALEEFLSDPSITEADREQGQTLLVSLKQSYRPEALPKPCEFDLPSVPAKAIEEPVQVQSEPKPVSPAPPAAKAWEPSDGTPGKAAEPQSQARRFEAVNTVIGGNIANVVFRNPGARA